MQINLLVLELEIDLPSGQGLRLLYNLRKCEQIRQLLEQGRLVLPSRCNLLSR